MIVQNLTATGGILERVAAGQDLVLEVIVSENGSAKDLTGALAASWKLCDLAKTSNLITKSLGSGIVLMNQSETPGGLQITLIASDTTNLAEGNYYHELSVTESGGTLSVVMAGLLKIYGRAV